MTRSDIIPSAISDAYQEAWEILNANPIAGPQVQHFWDAQDYVLGESETFARHWFERRHIDARAAIETAKTVVEGGSSDPRASMNALFEWQTGSAQRIAEDMREWIGLCSRCAGYVSRSEIEAGEEGIDKAEKATVSLKRRKDHLPV